MLYQVTTVLYETSKLNKGYAWSIHTLVNNTTWNVNIPETVNNPMWLCLVSQFFEMFCTNKLLINDDLVASKSRY